MFRWRSKSNQNQDDEVPNRDLKINELKAAIGPLTGRSLQYCTDACLRRYLEARNWNVDKAKKMLEETLKWRASFKPEEIRWKDVAVEGETGKVYRANFHDRNGRSVLVLRPGMQSYCKFWDESFFGIKFFLYLPLSNQFESFPNPFLIQENTNSPENQIRHLVYLIENAILNLPEDQEQMAWLIDFTGWSITNNVPIKTTRETINILQNHYPERLAVAFLYSPPRIFETFWKVVKYFLDTKTFEKVKFVYQKNNESVELMKSCFDMENLPVEFGGEVKMDYDHEEFSKMMSQDDVKYAKVWEINCAEKNHKINKDHSCAEVAPEPAI